MRLIKIKKENGFTLIEVVASIVIITIVLTSFAALFIQNNKTAVYNNEKLVVINLAHAELERLKIDPFIKNGEGVNNQGKITKPTTSNYTDKTTKITSLNNRDYTITITANQSAQEKIFKIINVTIEAMSSNGKAKNSVEGYVEYD